MPTTTDTQQNVLDWRTLHFARLDAALERGDRASAKQALCDLARLGVEVRFTLPPFEPDPASAEGAAS